MATLVSAQPFSIQMKKNILHASVNQVSKEMQTENVLIVVNLHVPILLKFMTTLQMIAKKKNIVNQTPAHLSCQSIPHGLVSVQKEHTDMKENVSQSATRVVLTKIKSIFTVHATKDIAATKARSIINTLV